MQFHVQDVVGPVVPDHRRHIQLLAGYGPEPLNRVHAGTIRLQVDDLAIRAGNRANASGIPPPMAPPVTAIRSCCGEFTVSR